MRYQLLQLFTANGESQESIAAEFETMVEACDESYRRFGKPFTTVVHDSETGERWSHREMIAGGFSNLCTEAEWREARRQLGMSTQE